MVRWPLVFNLGIAILLSGLPSTVSWAIHEQDHRFTIFGSVRDGRSFPGQLLSVREIRFLNAKTGQPWEIVDAQGRGRATVTTDREGQYSAILHVHNEDLGSVVKIVVDGTEKEFALTFDPQDNQTERRARVDIVVFPK